MTRRPTYPILLIGALILLTAWRWLASAMNGMELYADEAQYWTWSLDPDWGYYSKPPMVAWLIHAGTVLFGDGELGVRAATFLVWPLTSWVIFLFTRRLFRDEDWGARAAFWSALLFASLPLTALGGLLITTDGPLLLFWALSVYFTARALDGGRPTEWLLLGLCVGLGLLSKYSMVFFAPSLLVFLLTSAEHRRWLTRPWPYLGALLAGLVLVPNLLWNARHQYVSLQHTADIAQLDRAWLHWSAFVEFFGAQFAVFGPITAFALLALLWSWRAIFHDTRLRLLAALCLVPLAAFLTLSLLSRAFANWAAFAYVTGAPLIVAWWLRRARRAWLIAAIALNLAAASVVYHYHGLARLAGVELTSKTDIYKRVTGYRELGARVAGVLAAHPGQRLLVDDRKSMASLLYYARPASLEARYLNPAGEAIDDHYALTRAIRPGDDSRYLLVSQYASEPDLRRRFAGVETLAPVRVQAYPDFGLEYGVWSVCGYRGVAP
jgi:4-amino-4-deoxy-L-arabinose transferase-like glycosyltransferase